MKLKPETIDEIKVMVLGMGIFAGGVVIYLMVPLTTGHQQKPAATSEFPTPTPFGDDTAKLGFPDHRLPN